MEKEGLIRAIHELHENDLTMGTLVTDRHSQIAKWVRENLPDITHCYDVWHLAKGTILSLVNIIEMKYHRFKEKIRKNSKAKRLQRCRTMDEKHNKSLILVCSVN